jgi:hypothetical protein
MKLTLRRLRQLIREFGVDDTVRNTAGFFMAGGLSSAHRDRESSLMDPPPGLGSDAEETDDTEKDGDGEDKSQFAVRVDDKRGGPGRSSRNAG